MKIRLVEDELFYMERLTHRQTDGRTDGRSDRQRDRYDEANSRFSQICERA